MILFSLDLFRNIYTRLLTLLSYVIVYFCIFIHPTSQLNPHLRAKPNPTTVSVLVTHETHLFLITNWISMWLHFRFSPADGDGTAVDKPPHKEHPEAVSKSPSLFPHLLKPTAPASIHTPAAKQTLPAIHPSVKASLSPSSISPKSTPSSHPEHHTNHEHLPVSPLSGSSTSASEFTAQIFLKVWCFPGRFSSSDTWRCMIYGIILKSFLHSVTY